MFVARAYEYLVCCCFAVRRHHNPGKPVRTSAFDCVLLLSLGTAFNIALIIFTINYFIFGTPIPRYSNSVVVFFAAVIFSLNWLITTRLIGYGRIEERLAAAGVVGVGKMARNAFFYVFGSMTAMLILVPVIYSLGH